MARPQIVFGLLLKHHEYSIIRQNQGITSPNFIFPGPNSGWCAIWVVYAIVVSNSGANDSFPLTSHTPLLEANTGTRTVGSISGNLQTLTSQYE
jgi:hypothetical protein